jgi:hypothetical protein
MFHQTAALDRRAEGTYGIGDVRRVQGGLTIKRML